MKDCTTTPCSRTQPCIICGKTDYCFTGQYSNGTIHFCSQIKDPTVIAGGTTYRLKKITGQNYAAYEDEAQYQRNKEAWMKEQERTNPNFKKRRYHSSQSYSQRPVPMEVPVSKERVVVDEIPPLSNKALHEIYSYLLDLLILEPEHEAALLKEWNAGIEDDLGERLLKKWPIRSLPMNDQARRNSNTELKNMTRRELTKRLVERFKTLRGVPGFYLETYKKKGPNGKEESFSYWQMSALSGIVYPEYDSNGYIYRLRIGDEHPEVEEYAKDAAGNYLYYTAKNGATKHEIAAVYKWDFRTGEWYRYHKNGSKELVWSRQKQCFLVKINEKGYPIVDGKVSGKYKNFSSRRDMTNETATQIQIYNHYPEGTQSGSNISLYCKSTDDFRFVYVTEGEKKAIVMNMLLSCPVISIPGVNSYHKLFEKEYLSDRSMIDFLKSKGMQCIIIVFDADKAVNEMVLASEKGAIQECMNAGIKTFVGEWNAAFGKGADDVLIQGNRFRFIEKTQ